MIFYKINQNKLAEGRVKNIVKNKKKKNKNKKTFLIIKNKKDKKSVEKNKKFRYIFETSEDYKITKDSLKHQHFPPFDVGFHWTTNILYHV